ncbi:hypothetical protein KUTeg_020664, partial [Tegillarca granosa]
FIVDIVKIDFGCEITYSQTYIYRLQFSIIKNCDAMNKINSSDGTSGDSEDNGSFDDQPDFGILFDVDGVLARGADPLDPAVQALQMLKDCAGNLRVPVAFVTNACNRSKDKARQIEQWFDIPVSPDMVIHAPTPAKLLTEFHDKHVLVVGQEHKREIAEDIGFTNVCTIEDIQRAYPYLDVVDHDNRRRVVTILMIGEPKRWESCLQLLIDILVTNGKPNKAPPSLACLKQLPIIACNMDLVFMDRACMPRFGHGAFLVCLEALFKKITGIDLEYTALIGKPCEITYRYAEHTIATVAKRIGIDRPIKKLYFIGDNPQVDIVGANLYDRFLRESYQNRNRNRSSSPRRIPRSRSIPSEDGLFEQTVTRMESLLVGTGVYKHDTDNKNENSVYHGHRDIEHEPHLAKPSHLIFDHSKMRGLGNTQEEEYLTDSSETHSEDSVFDDVYSVDEQPDFGILFDVDGVLARGADPLDPAVQALQMLKDSSGNLKVPVAFVTNACNRSHDKANQIKSWFNIPVTPDMVIHAPTPARLLTEFHKKHVLVIGQDHRQEIAEDIGFTNTCTIEDVQKAYPYLDMVDHDNRRRVSVGSHTDDPNFPQIEAILMIGEPKRWESCLQLLIDLLLTNGKPNKAPTAFSPKTQLPIIACNMDLVFMDKACMPRFGHGAFLVCLEGLYKKITGKDLEYTALIGKPCEITYRYAEHTIAAVAKRLGIDKPIRKLYFIGDNPQVDIVGANLYDRLLRQSAGNVNSRIRLPRSRSIPSESSLYEQTVTKMESLLVETGVYKPDSKKYSKAGSDEAVYHGHRDIEHEPSLTEPSKYVPDVLGAIKHIFQQENFCSNT